MKRTLILLLGLVMTSSLWVGYSQVSKSLGKSMGRWKNFSVESMKQNRRDGLKYIEVTMNDVTGLPFSRSRLTNLVLKSGLYTFHTLKSMISLS